MYIYIYIIYTIYIYILHIIYYYKIMSLNAIAITTDIDRHVQNRIFSILCRRTKLKVTLYPSNYPVHLRAGHVKRGYLFAPITIR